MKSVITSLTERVKEMRDDRDYYKKKADGIDLETVEAVKSLNKSIKDIGEVVENIQADMRRDRRERG